MDQSFEWLNKKKKKVIELTVAMPALKAKRIIWLALESLRRQENINFGWELIIYEENAESIEVIKSFIGKLPECQRIKYRSIDPIKEGRQEAGKNKHKYLLIDKWVNMAKDSSGSTLVYVMKAVDNYSPPNRLSIHYKHITQDKFCIHSSQKKGVFYHIQSQRKMVYDGNSQTKALTHLYMAYRMSYFKKVNNKTNIRKHIDKYVRLCIEKETKYKMKPKNIRYIDDSDKNSWRKGLCTDGQNLISLTRVKRYDKPTKPFTKYKKEYKVFEGLPENVKKFLLDLKAELT